MVVLFWCKSSYINLHSRVLQLGSFSWKEYPNSYCYWWDILHRRRVLIQNLQCNLEFKRSRYKIHDLLIVLINQSQCHIPNQKASCFVFLVLIQPKVEGNSQKQQISRHFQHSGQNLAKTVAKASVPWNLSFGSILNPYHSLIYLQEPPEKYVTISLREKINIRDILVHRYNIPSFPRVQWIDPGGSGGVLLRRSNNICSLSYFIHSTPFHPSKFVTICSPLQM